MGRRESDIFDIPDEPHPDELKVFCKISAFKYIWRSSLHKDGHPITKDPLPFPPPTPKRYTNFVECEKCGLDQAWAPWPDL